MRDECEHGMLRRKCDRCEEHAEIERLRTRLAESEAEVGRLRGVQIVNDWDAAVRRAEAAEAEVGRLTEQDGAMLRNTMEALHAAEAERDDLLGALWGLEVSVQAMLAERDQALADYQSLGAEVLKLTAARDRALACEAAARGLLKSLAETILNIEGDRTSRGHEARSEAVIRACVRALSSPPSPTSAEGARCECCTGTEECCRCDDDCETGRARMAAGRDPTDCRPLPAPPSAPPSGVCNGCGNTVPLEEGADGFMRLTSHDGGECFYSYTLDWEPPPTSEVAP